MDDQIVQPTVFLVDDDPSVASALGRGLRAAGFTVLTWSNASDFLREHDPSVPGCVVADVTMPGLSGFDLQKALAASGCTRFIIFITGHGDIPMSVYAMKAGAVTFLPKPVGLEELMVAVREAIAKDAAARESGRRRATLDARLKALTAREHDVLELVVAGKMNKQIAAVLGISEKTVKVHRKHMMDKMHVRSIADLVNAGFQAGITRDVPRTGLNSTINRTDS